MPDSNPIRDADFEHRLRNDLAARAEAPDLAARRHHWDAAMRNRRSGVDRRRFLVGAAAASAAVAGVGITWAVARDEGEGEPVGVTAGPTSTTTGSAPVRGWTEIPTAPLSRRMDPAVVWAGDRLIVWGGSAARGGQQGVFGYPSDGASWDPSSNQWSPIASNPGLIRGGFAIWSGAEMLVGPIEADAQEPWNVDASEEEVRYGLAAYDPTADTWRDVAPIADDRSLRADGQQAVLVDGKVLIAPRSVVAGASGPAQELLLIDPATGDRATVAPGPFAVTPYPDGSGTVALTAAADLVVAVPNWDTRPWVLDVTTGAWRRPVAPPQDVASLHFVPGVAVGDVALLRESSSPTWWIFDPTRTGQVAWQRVAPVSSEPESFPQAQWQYDEPVGTDTTLFVPGAAYDLASDTWRVVAPPPRGKNRQRTLKARWTGDSLLLFGGEEYTCTDDAACDRNIGPDTLDGWLLVDP